MHLGKKRIKNALCPNTERSPRSIMWKRCIAIYIECPFVEKKEGEQSNFLFLFAWMFIKKLYRFVCYFWTTRMYCLFMPNCIIGPNSLPSLHPHPCCGLTVGTITFPPLNMAWPCDLLWSRIYGWEWRCANGWPEIKTHYKATVIKSLWDWYSNSQIIHWTKIANPELDTRIYKSLTNDRVELNSVEKRWSVYLISRKKKNLK